ncbi:hypothetical protein AB0I72_14600 [Nocardiopsis sp. NPDC049922]|uniref:hypothetical protein n=1 Tax=Nocardiopsis sp. NPDC049922 TaxID=3155157 RepID=UPI0033F350C2
MGNGAQPRRSRDQGCTNTVGPPSAVRWTLLCAAAEAVAVSAALFGDPSGAGQVSAVVSFILAGGLVEGAALGSAQALGLRRWLHGVARPRALVTGLG